MGHPKNKKLLRLHGKPEWRKLLDKVETELNSDLQKEELYRLKEDLYYSIDERQHQADLSEIGRKRLRPDNPDAFVLPDLATEFSEIDRDTRRSRPNSARNGNSPPSSVTAMSPRRSTISQLLRAYSLYERDVEYVVQDGKVMIVDENTGRVMPGRRWSDGLHQAVEAKEGVTIERETRTYATITIQNYFRLYDQARRHDRHRRDRGRRVPRHLPPRGAGHPDEQALHPRRPQRLHLQDPRDKFNAVVREIEAANKRGQPVLVGTVSRRVLRGALPHAQARGRDPHRAEREVPPAGGRDRLPRRPARRRHRSPPTWRAAAPTSNWARACANSAASTSSAPSATNPAASTASCAAVARARATPADQVLPLARGRPDAALPPGQPRLAPDGGFDEGRRGARASLAQPLDRERAEEGRAAELRAAQTPAAVRRRAQPAARGHLRHPQRHDPRGPAEGHHFRAGGGGGREPPRSRRRRREVRCDPDPARGLPRLGQRPRSRSG
jgi:hypothetical protein